MMDVAKTLKQMGFKDDQIATVKVDGKPLAEVEVKKPSLVDGMNKTEALFAFELDMAQKAGEIKRWSFQAVKLRLANKTWYTPDFFVEFFDGRLRFVEIKGFLRDDAAVKFKVARETHSWAEFIMLRKIKGHFVPVNI